MLVLVTVAAACVAFTLPAAAEPTCSTAGTGAGCAGALNSGGQAGKRIRVAPVAPQFGVGDTLPRGRYSLLLNSEYYGLPPADGDWRYYRVEGRVLRVRPETLQILGDATAETNAAF